MVVEGEASPVGLTVDEVHEVMTLDAAIKPAPPLSGNDRCDYVRGIARRDDRLIVLLDLDRVLGRLSRGHGPSARWPVWNAVAA